MKQRRLSVRLIAAIAAAVLICGTALAYMFRQTEAKENLFTPAQVSCTVQEQFDGTQKSGIKIQNTGTIEAYLRLRLVSYWVDADGNVVAKPSEMPTVSLQTGWIKGANDTYYYQLPVAPGGVTGALANPIVLQKDANGYLQVLEVFAEAIQSKPQNAVTSAWGVTVDANGRITSATG